MSKKEYVVLNDQFIHEINPFEWMIDENNVSAIRIPTLNHMKAIFDKHIDEGFVCCGFDWCTLIIMYLERYLPHFLDEAEFEPKDDEVFIISKSSIQLQLFASSFRKVYEDPNILEELMASVDYIS